MFGTPGAAGMGSDTKVAYRPVDSIESRITSCARILFWCPSYVKSLQAILPEPVGTREPKTFLLIKK